MTNFYFICMANYYRSRLAEELTRYYANEANLVINVDSGGLRSDFPVSQSTHPGCIAPETLEYLKNKGIEPYGISREPKPCIIEEISIADIIVCTEESEQRHLFERNFPEYSHKVVYWHAFDKQYDPHLNTRELIDKKVKHLLNSHFNIDLQ